eukprot:3461607-Alexandrium_andersonii.AAC.1
MHTHPHRTSDIGQDAYGTFRCHAPRVGRNERPRLPAEDGEAHGLDGGEPGHQDNGTTIDKSATGPGSRRPASA